MLATLGRALDCHRTILFRMRELPGKGFAQSIAAYWSAPFIEAIQRPPTIIVQSMVDADPLLERLAEDVRQERLAQNTETAVQMHFSAQSHRTNEIMKTLTAVTAVFLPLNLITGFFGMNFEFLPLIHHTSGLWWAVGTMVTVAVALAGLFWRKRYLARSAN